MAAPTEAQRRALQWVNDLAQLEEAADANPSDPIAREAFRDACVEAAKPLAEGMADYIDEKNRYQAALVEIDRMNPDDYRTGQDHLSPAFREVNFRDAFMFVCKVVNGVLHGTDEHGRSLEPTNGDSDG